MKEIDNIPHTCLYCNYRHCCNKEDIPKNDECQDFILGKCFYCAIHRSDPECKETQELCIYGEWNWPEGCENFKPGLYYDEYRMSKSNKEQTYEDKVSDIFTRDKDALRHSRRRKATEKIKQKRISNYNNTGGWYRYPYIVKSENLVKSTEQNGSKTINYEPITPYLRRWDKKSGWKKWVKRQSNKKIRRSKGLYQGWSGHKLYEYWWTLW